MMTLKRCGWCLPASAPRTQIKHTLMNKNINKIFGELKEKIQKAVMETACKVKDIAVEELTPSHKSIADSIEVNPAGNASEPAVIVGVTHAGAPAVEFGFNGESHPFLNPALESARKEFKDDLQKAIKLC